MPRLVPLLAGGAMLLVAVAATQAALAGALARSSPATALAIDDSQSVALIAAGRAILGDADGDSARAAEALGYARRAVAAAPASAEPFYLGAIAAERQGDADAALRLMRAAVQRDPRLTSARYWLFDRSLRARRFGEAIENIDAFMRIRPSVRFAVAQALVPLLGEPEARAGLARALADNPNWGPAFLMHASRDAGVRGQFVGMLIDLSRDPDFILPQPLLSATVNGALGAGSVDLARTLYASYATNAAEPSPNQVQDPQFTGRLPAPFGWTFVNGRHGFAEPREEAGARHVFARMFNDEAQSLASQTLTLAPGDYRFETRFQSAETGFSAGYAVRLACTRSNQPLAVLRLPESGTGAITLARRFTVPAGCGVQQIELGFDPAFGRAASVRLTAIAITAAGVADAGS
ncbi:tetratricopeptide repeat protein [Sphingomonas baiyangensis]|uniref:Tetratricopeptide repeat protein n=1 Tax=Sphingomonas baiyangensis TaxID=2572576 RepID=A0A4U1L2B5_9SPHN|nr:hypothetical protein [Sphingomonas baiyangensis]TKD50313.1 hypothetical protein FBR43_05720 [Sphingomonas baiyangensis]